MVGPANLFVGADYGVLLDIQNADTVFSDAAGTVKAELGDPVRRVNDLSGSGNHLSVRSGNPPTLRAAGGLRYLEFTTTTGFVEIRLGRSLTTMTRMLGYRLTAYNSTGRIITTNDYSLKNMRSWQAGSGNQFAFAMQHDSNGVDIPAPGLNVDATLTHIYSGTVAKGRTNDNDFTTNSQTGSETYPGVLLFNREALDRPSTGRVYSLFLIDRELTEQEQTEVRAWSLAPYAASVTVLNAWSGHAGADRATVAHRLSADTSTRLVVSTSPDLSNPSYSLAKSSSSKTVKHTITGLAENTTYYYGLEVNGTISADGRGRFITAGAGAHSFKFGLGGCAKSYSSPTLAWLAANTALAFMLYTGRHSLRRHCYERPSAVRYRAGQRPNRRSGRSPAQSCLALHVRRP